MSFGELTDALPETKCRHPRCPSLMQLNMDYMWLLHPQLPPDFSPRQACLPACLTDLFSHPLSLPARPLRRGNVCRGDLRFKVKMMEGGVAVTVTSCNVAGDLLGQSVSTAVQFLAFWPEACLIIYLATLIGAPSAVISSFPSWSACTETPPPPAQHILVLVLANARCPRPCPWPRTSLCLCHSLPLLSTSPIFIRILRTLLGTLLVSPYLVCRPR